MNTRWVIRKHEDIDIVSNGLAGIDITKPLEVIVRELKSKRSTAQNSTHWWRLNWLADQLAAQTGHTSKELHEYLKAEFCPLKCRKVLDADIYMRSTTLLTTQEFAEMMTRIEAWAASEWALELPEPIPARVRG